MKLRGRPIWVAGGLVAAGVMALALALFQPWKLVVDQRADDPEPVAVAPTAPAATPGGPAATPGSGAPGKAAGSGGVLFTTRTWKSYEHETKGTVVVYRLADGRRVLRLTDLRTSNGPDLKVYLSGRPYTSGEFGSGFVNLGTLKGNTGSSNYEIPEDVDLGRQESVVIWCKRFAVPFGAAPLRPA